MFEEITLETAVRDGKVMQDFDPELLPIGGSHSQMVKGPPIGNDSGSKDCVNLPSPTAVFRVTSLQNPKIKKAVKLADRKERNETGLFLIEGYRELKRASDSGVVIQTLFICPKFFLGSNEEALIDQIRKTRAEIISCHESVFQKLSYRDRPDGLVAIAIQMQRSLQDLIAQLAMKKDPFLIIAEAIEKPGNLGTILRSADAAGVDGVIVCDRCTDIYNPNVVRASVGTLFTIPVVEASSADTLLWLQQRKIKVVAATPSAKEEFTDASLTGGVAIAVGTEQLGLTKLWMDAADLKVRIPMHGVADSLNVATATTLLLYEVVRQRIPKQPQKVANGRD